MVKKIKHLLSKKPIKKMQDGGQVDYPSLHSSLLVASDYVPLERSRVTSDDYNKSTNHALNLFTKRKQDEFNARPSFEVDRKHLTGMNQYDQAEKETELQKKYTKLSDIYAKPIEDVNANPSNTKEAKDLLLGISDILNGADVQGRKQAMQIANASITPKNMNLMNTRFVYNKATGKTIPWDEAESLPNDQKANIEILTNAKGKQGWGRDFSGNSENGSFTSNDISYEDVMKELNEKGTFIKGYYSRADQDANNIPVLGSYGQSQVKEVLTTNKNNVSALNSYYNNLGSYISDEQKKVIKGRISKEKGSFATENDYQVFLKGLGASELGKNLVKDSSKITGLSGFNTNNAGGGGNGANQSDTPVTVNEVLVPHNPVNLEIIAKNPNPKVEGDNTYKELMPIDNSNSLSVGYSYNPSIFNKKFGTAKENNQEEKPVLGQLHKISGGDIYFNGDRIDLSKEQTWGDAEIVGIEKFKSDVPEKIFIGGEIKDINKDPFSLDNNTALASAKAYKESGKFDPKKDKIVVNRKTFVVANVKMSVDDYLKSSFSANNESNNWYLKQTEGEMKETQKRANTYSNGFLIESHNNYLYDEENQTVTIRVPIIMNTKQEHNFDVFMASSFGSDANKTTTLTVPKNPLYQTGGNLPTQNINLDFKNWFK